MDVAASPDGTEIDDILVAHVGHGGCRPRGKTSRTRNNKGCQLDARMPAPRPPSGPPRGRCEKLSVGFHLQETDEAGKLREENGELRARCEWQASALRELRTRLEEVEGQAANTTTVPLGAPPGMPRRPGNAAAVGGGGLRLTPMTPRHTERGTQTASDDQFDRLEVLEQQLEAAHKKAAEKSRELRVAHEHNISLEDQLKRQVKLIGQYKDEINALEDQLRITTQKQHRAEDERSIAERALQNVRNAWGDCKVDPSEDSTRASSMHSTMRTPRSWAGARRPVSAGSASSKMAPRSQSRNGCKEVAAFEESSSEEEDRAKNSNSSRGGTVDRLPTSRADIPERLPSSLAAIPDKLFSSRIGSPAARLASCGGGSPANVWNLADES